MGVTLKGIRRPQARLRAAVWTIFAAGIISTPDDVRAANCGAAYPGAIGDGTLCRVSGISKSECQRLNPNGYDSGTGVCYFRNPNASSGGSAPSVNTPQGKALTPADIEKLFGKPAGSGTAESPPPRGNSSTGITNNLPESDDDMDDDMDGERAQIAEDARYNEDQGFLDLSRGDYEMAAGSFEVAASLYRELGNHAGVRANEANAQLARERAAAVGGRKPSLQPASSSSRPAVVSTDPVDADCPNQPKTRMELSVCYGRLSGKFSEISVQCTIDEMNLNSAGWRATDERTKRDFLNQVSSFRACSELNGRAADYASCIAVGILNETAQYNPLVKACAEKMGFVDSVGKPVSQVVPRVDGPGAKPVPPPPPPQGSDPSNSSISGPSSPNDRQRGTPGKVGPAL